jgi:diguanylate cyclase (GGDEF)-like protein
LPDVRPRVHLAEAKEMTQRAAPRGRLWIVWVALLVPTLISAVLLLRGNVARITQMADERMAIVVIARLQETIRATQAYRFRVASNVPHAGEAVALESDLATLDALYRSAPARLTLRENRERIEDAWSAIRREVVPSEASLSDLIAALAVGVQSASDNSLITYDPDNAAINLGDAVAVQYLKSNIRFGDIVSLVAHAQHARASLHDRLAAARFETPALDAVRLGGSDVSDALHADASIDPSLGSAALALQRDATRYVAFLDASYIDRAGDRTRAIVRQGLEIAAEQLAFQQRLERELIRNLERRTAAERLAELGTVLIAALLAIASFAIVGVTLRTLAQAQQFELVQAERKREQDVYAIERELFATQEQFRVTFEEVPVGILIADERMERMQANPALHALVANVDSILDDDRDIVRALMADGGHERFERHYRKRDGTEAWAEVALRGVSGADGEKRYVLGTFRDITESRALACRLVHEAQHDALTGLPNRAFLERSLRALIDGVEAGASYALCYLDLDDFKLVNDSVGHAAGDALLIATSKRLRAALPPETMVARMGGDEFAILLARGPDATYRRSLEHIVEAVCAPFSFDGFSLKVRASVGVVALGVASLRFQDALRDADTAMYEAKARGGGQFVVFDASMHEDAKRRMQLRTELIEAVSRD